MGCSALKLLMGSISRLAFILNEQGVHFYPHVAISDHFEQSSISFLGPA
jgi:hypothetical protein